MKDSRNVIRNSVKIAIGETFKRRILSG